MTLEIPGEEGGTVGENIVHLGIFYMPEIYDIGPTALLLLRRKAS
jgi:hypothetical protein